MEAGLYAALPSEKLTEQRREKRMKKYIEPDFEIIKFNQSDVITDSSKDNDVKDKVWGIDYIANDFE